MINELIEKEINKFMDKMRNINSIESPDIYLDRVRKFSTELSCGVAKEVAMRFRDELFEENTDWQNGYNNRVIVNNRLISNILEEISKI